MRQSPSHLTKNPTALKRAMLAIGAVALSWLSGCSAPPKAPPTAGPSDLPAAAPQPDTRDRPVITAPEAAPPTSQPSAQGTLPGPSRSAARNAKEYRKDAASHLYGRHSQHIYKGRLPPMLQAVGVLNVDIDRHGAVKSLQWTRAPRHAPQVMQHIERMVKAAAPFPVPQHMGQVTYTDVWLWHQSGRFQLDTLTEGQD
jgi:hypothetical protein